MLNTPARCGLGRSEWVWATVSAAGCVAMRAWDVPMLLLHCSPSHTPFLTSAPPLHAGRITRVLRVLRLFRALRLLKVLQLRKRAHRGMDPHGLGTVSVSCVLWRVGGGGACADARRLEGRACVGRGVGRLVVRTYVGRGVGGLVVGRGVARAVEAGEVVMGRRRWWGYVVWGGGGGSK